MIKRTENISERAYDIASAEAEKAYRREREDGNLHADSIYFSVFDQAYASALMELKTFGAKHEILD